MYKRQLLSSAVGKTFAAGGDCGTCHTGTFDVLHASHLHTVAEGPGDLSFDPPGQLCSVCHVVSNWAEIDGTEHNVPTNGAGSCSTCHNSPRQEVIDAITLGADPTVCLDCHSNKLLTVHGNEDHGALGYVTGGATNCQTCHDPGASYDGTVTVTHLGNCALCHTSPPALQPGLVAGDCSACHGSTWDPLHQTANYDHSGFVTVATTSCASCHDDTLISATTETHNACISCHDAANGALIGSAVGKDVSTGGDCTTCHTGAWEAEHPEPTSDHTALVTVGATSCGSCHNDTLVSAERHNHHACGRWQS